MCSFIGGHFLNDFEREVAKYVGTRHAIGCSSGSDALLLALKSLDVGDGDEVITTPFTYYATIEMIIASGAKPVLVDVDFDTYLIDMDKIKQAINEKTKAIIPVSLFGQTCDMTSLDVLSKWHGIAIIEDAAQSFGASHRTKKSCNLSIVACTSFFPAKSLGAYGDGGAVFTNSDDLSQKIRQLLNHGQNKPYNHLYVGMNARLDNLQASVLSVKLKYLDRELESRKNIAQYYNHYLDRDKIFPQKVHANNDSIYSLYCFTSPNRDRLKQILKSKNTSNGNLLL